MRATVVIKNLLKLNCHPMGEYSPYLVILSGTVSAWEHVDGIY
jgi:hypothetical protein